MSFRQKTGEVRAAGAARRRNWNPDPASIHYKIYQWWLKKSGKVIPRENLCHYMRVVLFWAPLRAVAKPLLFLAALTVICGLVAITVISPMDALGFAMLIFGFAYLVFGTIIMKQQLHDILPDEIDKVRWLNEKTNTINAGLVILTLPVVLIESMLLIIILSLFTFLHGLKEDYDAYGRTRRWLMGAQFSDHKSFSWIHPWLIAPVGLITWSFIFGFAETLLIVGGGVVVFFGTLVSLFYLADLVKEKQAAAVEAEQEQVRLKAERRQHAVINDVVEHLFAIQHPEWVGNQYQYESWLTRYKRHCYDRYGNTIYRITPSSHLYWVSVKYERLFERAYEADKKYSSANDGQSSYVVQKKRFVKIKAALAVVIDILALAWAFVLTKKWGICPIVELPVVRPE